MIPTAALEDDSDLYHLNAEQAYLQPKLDTAVYIEMPDECGEPSGKVV